MRRVRTRAEAEDALSRERFHAMLVELGPDRHDSLELAAALPELARRMPVVVHAQRPLDSEETKRVEACSEERSLWLAPSDDRLVIVVSTALHHAESSLPPAQRERLTRALERSGGLEGRTVLIVDDDVCNIFAMTSSLERHGARVLYAETGRQGLELLRANARGRRCPGGHPHGRPERI